MLRISWNLHWKLSQCQALCSCPSIFLRRKIEYYPTGINALHPVAQFDYKRLLYMKNVRHLTKRRTPPNFFKLALIILMKTHRTVTRGHSLVISDTTLRFSFLLKVQDSLVLDVKAINVFAVFERCRSSLFCVFKIPTITSRDIEMSKKKTIDYVTKCYLLLFPERSKVVQVALLAPFRIHIFIISYSYRVGVRGCYQG